jgi:CRISPR-associated protein Cmr5
MQTRDQRYAEKIFEQVSAFKQQHPQPKQQREYGSMAHKLPVLIRTAGLAQGLAFVAANGKPPHQQLLDDLAKAIAHLNGDQQTAAQLLEKSRTVSLGNYMKLTQDALSALLWYKRFAQSVLNVEPGDEPAENETAQLQE